MEVALSISDSEQPPEEADVPEVDTASAAGLRKDPLWKRVFRRIALLLFFGVLFTGVLVSLLRIVDPPIWAWRVHRAVFPPVDPMPEVRHAWVGREAISPKMELAAIAAEDQLFPEHFGFDWSAITAAMEYNQEGDRIRGGSTITQQTAKNLFLWPSRSWLRKGVEAYFTLLLELLWPKARILEVYLNIAEFGPGIFGVEAASRHYFAVPASDLSAGRAARLAAVLPGPYRYRVEPPSEYVIRRSEWIRRQMRQLGPATLEAVDSN